MYGYLRIVQKGDKLPNPVDPIDGRIQFRNLTKHRKQVASTDAPQWRVMFRPSTIQRLDKMYRRRAYQPRSSIITVFRPSGSSMEENKALIASSTAERGSSSISSSDSTFTNEFKITVSLRLRAFPATVTSDASARALKTVIGIAVSVGIKMGKTVEART